MTGLLHLLEKKQRLARNRMREMLCRHWLERRGRC